MRRIDREVKDKTEIFDILAKCQTIRVGISGDKYPYVVPISFGIEIKCGKAIIYFHCAQQGLKIDLLKKNSFVCVEGEVFKAIEVSLIRILTLLFLT